VCSRSLAGSSGGEMDPISLKDLDEVDLLLTELEISQGRGNLVLCIVASPAYREKVIEAVKARFSARILPVETGDSLISDLRNTKLKDEEILIWTLPETLAQDVLDALNNFRELFYDAGVPSLIFMTPAELDDVIWKAPDFWRYRGGYHILKGEDYGQAYQAVEALSMPLDFSYQNEEELLRRKRINEYLLEKIQNKREKIKIILELGTVHLLLSEPRKAKEYYKQALAIAREIGDRMVEGAALGDLGNAHAALGEAQKAVEYYEQAQAIASEIGDRRGEINHLCNQGLAYSSLNETRKAIENNIKALAISRDIKDRRSEGVALGNIGSNLFEFGEVAKAIDYYDQALEIARETKDKKNEAVQLERMALLFAGLGKMRKALEFFAKAIFITRKIGDRIGEANNLFNMSKVFDELGKRKKAIDTAKSALSIFKQIESPYAETARNQLAKWQRDDLKI